MKRAAWRAALALIGAFSLLRLSADLRAVPYHYSLPRGGDSGEAILHRLRLDEQGNAATAFLMPMLSLTDDVLFFHDGGLLKTRDTEGAIGVLALGTGVLLLVLTGSLTPAVVYALFFRRGDWEETFFSFLVLVMAGVLLWRARKPGARRSLVLGLALGATLLFRSSLAFFPPVLALYEWLFLYRRSARLYWKHLLCLCVVPYLALVPWAALNWVLLRRFIPFENGAAKNNMITGALGLVQTIEGNARGLIGPRPGGAGYVFFWALRQVCGHPLRYAAAYLARLMYVFSLSPALLIAALAALWIYREREEFRQLGLFVLYFVGVYCLMSVQSNYFAPLWPLASILAGAFVDRFRPGGGEAIGPWFRRLRGAASGAALAAVLALGLWTETAVGAYAWHAAFSATSLDEDLDRAVRLYPRDAWPLLERGKLGLDQGRLPQAAADLSRGVALSPGPEEALSLAWVKMLLGRPAPLLRWRPPAYSLSMPLSWTTAHVLKAHGYLRLGQAARAREELQAARDSYKAAAFSRGDTASAAEAIGKLRRDPLVDHDLLVLADRLLASRPAGERLALANALAR